jgi:hypothetical protein
MDTILSVPTSWAVWPADRPTDRLVRSVVGVSWQVWERRSSGRRAPIGAQFAQPAPVLQRVDAQLPVRALLERLERS